MCDVQAALQVAGAVVAHRQKKADNKAIEETKRQLEGTQIKHIYTTWLKLTKKKLVLIEKKH